MSTDKFDSYVCVGDEIECETGPFRVTARVVFDDHSSPHDLDGPGCCFDTSDPDHGEENESIIAAWHNDEWFYCGIVLTVELADTGTILTDHGASLWGIECNFPGGDNSYLMDVANELLQEAIDEANQIANRIKESI